MKNVVVCTPAAGYRLDVRHDHAVFLAREACRDMNIGWSHPIRVGGSTTADARNTCCEEALQHPINEILIFIDSDILFTPKDFLDLVAHASEVGIVGAHYPAKRLDWEKGVNALLDSTMRGPTRLPFEEEVRILREAVMGGHWLYEDIPQTEKEVPGHGTRIRCDNLPGGFLAIRADVLRAYREETGHAWAYRKNDSAWLYAFFRDEIINQEMQGEDYMFCRSMRHAAHDVWRMRDLHLRHIGEVIFG